MSQPDGRPVVRVGSGWHGRALRTHDDFWTAYVGQATVPTIWLCRDGDLLDWLGSASHQPGGNHLLILFGRVAPTRLALARAYFGTVLSGATLALLPPGELSAVLSADQGGQHLVGAAHAPDVDAVVLYTSGLMPLIVPKRMFPITANGIAPDFTDIAVIDHGCTLRLGPYEAAADSLIRDASPGA